MSGVSNERVHDQRMHQMRRCHIGLGVVAAVLAFSLSGGRASAQQTTPQQPYGYATPQTPYASPQGGGAGCYPQRAGCQVFVCPNPCQAGPAAYQAYQAQIPPIQSPPSGNEAPAWVVQNELPPPPAQNVVIYRNCY